MEEQRNSSFHVLPVASLGHKLHRSRSGKTESNSHLPSQDYTETGENRSLGSQQLRSMECLQYCGRSAGGSSQFVDGLGLAGQGLSE